MGRQVAAVGAETVHPKVVVVVATYNEAENLPPLVRRLFALDIPDCNILVVDDGSPDGTGDVASRLGEEREGRVELVQRHKKMGLGAAYVDGLGRALHAGADYVIQMDADLSHAPEYVPAFLDALQDADVVVGSRYAPGGGVEDEWRLRRFLLSAIGNWGIRLIAGLNVRDATSGFKGFRREVLASMDLTKFRCKGFAFQAEMVSVCERRGYSVVEHPIVFGRRASGESKLSLAIVVEALWRLFPLRWKRGGHV